MPLEGSRSRRRSRQVPSVARPGGPPSPEQQQRLGVPEPESLQGYQSWGCAIVALELESATVISAKVR